MSDALRTTDHGVALPISRRARRAAERRPGRIASSLLATVPIVLVGSFAITAATPTTAHAASPSVKPAKTPAPSGASAATVRPTPPASYRVLAGDTVSSIAGRYGLSTASVLALNGLGWKSLIFPGQVLRLAKAAQSPATAPTTSSRSYTVTAGDTVTSVAARFGASVASVLRANGLSASSIIFPGSRLTIPSAGAATIAAQPATSVTPTTPVTRYTIARGDTLTSIAAKFGVPVATLLSTNGYSASSIIYPGQSIVVPATSAYVAGVGVVTVLTDEMATNARTIIRVGRSLGVNDQGLVVALAAAMQESALRNIDYGHLDSLGLFQQRPSIGWGTREQLLDPEYASRVFFGGPTSPKAGVARGLLDVAGWQGMSVTRAAQAVQVSAHPDAYAQWERSARYWVSELG